MSHGKTTILPLLILTAGCSAPHFALEPTYGRLESKGDISLTEVGQPRAANSLDRMGLAERDESFGLRADFEWGAPHLTLGTQRGEWAGAGTVDEFGAITGSAVAVDSRAELGFHRALLTFDVLPLPMLELGLGLGVSAVDVEAQVVDALDSRREEIDEFVPIPVLAARLGLAVWRLEFEALAAGMGIEISGDEAVYFDLDLAARFALARGGPLEALLSLGYRRIDLDLEYEDDGEKGEVDVVVDGLYVGLRLAF